MSQSTINEMLNPKNYLTWQQMREIRQNQVATLLDVEEDDNEDTSTMQTWQQMREVRQNKTATLLEGQDDEEDTSSEFTSGAFTIEPTGGTSKSTNFTYKLVTLKKVRHLKRFENLIFPNFKQQWEAILERATVKGIIAYLGEQKVGLILVEISSDKKTADIVSWFVLPQHRQQGIGYKLLRCIEKYLLSIKCDRLTISYQASKLTKLAVERILEKLKWQKPETNCLRFKSSTDEISQAPWFNQFTLPQGFSIIPWSDLKPEDINEFLHRKPHSNAIALLGRNERIEKLNSLVLYHGKKLVGWIVNHRIASDTIRYSNLYIQSEVSSPQLKVVLLSESIKKQLNSFIPYGDLIVVNPQLPILKLIYRYLKPYSTTFSESRQSFKKL